MNDKQKQVVKDFVSEIAKKLAENNIENSIKSGCLPFPAITKSEFGDMISKMIEDLAKVEEEEEIDNNKT